MKNIVVFAYEFDKLLEPLLNNVKNERVLVVSFLPISENTREYCVEKFSEIHFMDNIDFKNMEKICHQIEMFSKKVELIIAVEEYALLPAAQCREKFNVKGMKTDEILVYRNKFHMIKNLVDNIVKLPAYKLLDQTSPNEFLEKYNKIVLKPTMGMGSKHMYVLDNIVDLDFALNHRRKDKEYLVEEYIDGTVYHCDIVVQNGEIILFSSMQYLDFQYEFNQNKFLRSISVTDECIKNELLAASKDVVNQFSINNSVLHLELIRNKKGIYFCEVGKRAGGAAVVEVINAMFGINLIEADIKLQLNEPITEIKQKYNLGGWIIFHPEEGVITKIRGVEEINSNKSTTSSQLFIRVGEQTHKPKYCSTSVASFTFVANSPTELIKNLQFIEDTFNVMYQKKEENLV